MNSHIAFLVFVAIQDSTMLDGKRQSRLYIRLKHVGCMLVKGH